MESWLQNFFSWLPSGGSYYLLITFIAFFESITGLGLLMPGSVLVVFAGFLAANGKGALMPLVLCAGAGALLGDMVSFWMGARIGPNLMQLPFMQKRRGIVRRAETFFLSHGGKSVFFGRFIGPIRGFIPFVAGSTRMNPLTFLGYTLISAILWGLSYPGLGYLGGASWLQVRKLSGRLSLLMATLVALLILNGLLWKKLAPRIVARGALWWGKFRDWWERLLGSPAIQKIRLHYPRMWQFLADRFSLRRGAGLYLTTGLACSALFASLFIWLTEAVEVSERLGRLDEWVYQAMAQLHHPIADRFFVGVTFLGSTQAVLILGLLALLWLILDNRDFSATILVAGTLGGELLVFLLKWLFDRPRPVPLLPHLQLYSASFPSAHAFVALVFYGLLTYMLLGNVRNWQSRVALVFTGSFTALLIGFSRIYLGVHWFSDVLAGFALAALWLTFLVTASEIRRRYAGEFPWGKGWKPLQLPEKLHRAILLVATLCALGGIAQLIRLQILQIG